ncbi:MAG: hypothetical protein FIA89_15335 [Geobacter sp.]|nr:hypothetical protein [Geobacter sp.]
MIRWYGAQPVAERHACHAEHKQIITRMLNDARSNGTRLEADGELSYGAFLLALDNRSRLLDGGRLKATEDLEAVTNHRIAVEKQRRMSKPSPKLDRLHGDLLPVVKRLREEGLSWAKVSAYLAKYHKLKVSRGYLQDTFAEST